jgi:Phosphodiester glycosidase
MGKGKRATTRLLALVAIFGLAVASLPPSVEAGKRKKQWRWVAPGVHMRLFRLDAPNKVRVVRLDASARATVDTVLASNRLPGRETVTSMARRTGAIAAINGDYSRPSGRPVFTFARDGRLDQLAAILPSTGHQTYGRNFALDVHKRRVFMTHPKTHAWIWVPGSEEDRSYEVHRMNDRSLKGAARRQIRAFTSAGGSDERPPNGGCYVRLRSIKAPQSANPTHAPRRSNGAKTLVGVEQKYVVANSRCRYERMYPVGGITLYSPRDGRYADQLKAIRPGSEVTFGWSLGWPEVFDTVGGNPTLIEKNKVQHQSVYGGGSFVSGRHPRTAVAYNRRSDRLYFVTVDGRRSRYSRGMTLAQLTSFLRSRLGATDALNLDGGGSTTMVVKGKLRGKPSDGSVRGVSSALVILPGRDPGEPRRARTTLANPALGAAPWIGDTFEAPASETSFDAMAEDPASVGGLAVWLEQEGHELPGFLEHTAAEFRASREPVTD